MMAAVAKAQQYAAQQHTTLRLPLVRLYNEVETFRYRAFTDTFLTVRKMEKSRTEYRGALLWMKNVSMELDPDATRKLEKFRRVQAQVKKTKTKFDRLKTDAIQKIDLLSASRCNMFSHVLVNYQRTLIQFWEKTARTFNAVSDSFKGYQYYEFNIIKDLVEPSKKVADIVNKSKDEIKKLEKVSQQLEQEIEDENKSKLISFDDLEEEKKEEEEDKPLDEVNQLIDLMTLNEANSFNEQLKELEQLEEEKKKRKTNNTSKDKLESIKLLNDSKLTFDFSASSISKVFTRTSNNNNGNEKTDLVNLDFNNLANATNTNTQSPNVFSSFNELINSKNDEFEREWQSAFQNNNNNNNSTKSDLSSDDFGNFVTASQSFSSLTDATTTPIKSLFSTELFLNKTQQPNNPTNNISSSSSDDKSKLNKQETNKNSNNKSNWYDLFAELDPLKNPDAIGSLNGLEEERNC
jgi:hypothetical protein